MAIAGVDANRAWREAKARTGRAWASTTVFLVLVLAVAAAVFYAQGARAARDSYRDQSAALNGRMQLMQACVANVVNAPAGDGAGGPADEGHPMAYCLLPLLKP